MRNTNNYSIIAHPALLESLYPVHQMGMAQVLVQGDIQKSEN
ncbi:hypothetical protein [Vibrio sp. YIC-376]